MKVKHLSASRIKTYYQCPFQYHAIYDLGMRGDPHPLTNMGSGVHFMFENATNTMLGVGKCESDDPHWYKDAAIKEYDIDEDLWPLMSQLVDNGIQWGYFRNIPKTFGCEVEVNFELPDGTKVTGFIDRLDIASPWADVIDLKTQKREFDEATLANNWQARIYNIGTRKIVEEVMGKICVSFWVLRHRVQRVWLTEKDAERDIQELVGIAEEIRSCENPEKKPSGLCPWCPYYSKCDAPRQGVKAKFRSKSCVKK